MRSAGSSAFERSLASERTGGLLFHGFALLPGTFRYKRWLGPKGSGWLAERGGRRWRVDDLNEVRDKLAAVTETAHGEDPLPGSPPLLKPPRMADSLPAGPEVPTQLSPLEAARWLQMWSPPPRLPQRRLGTMRLHDVQRDRVETGLRHALGQRFPGRTVSVGWSDRDPPGG